MKRPGVLASLVLVVCLVVTAPAQAAPRIALVIGNSAYEQTGWALSNARGDAELVAASLTQVGFDVELVADADEAALRDAARRFGRRLRQAGEDAIGFFYFSGHGMQSEGFNYLIPTDIDAQVEQDVWAQAPRVGLITRYMNAAGNTANFIVLDACRNNPLPSASRSVGAGGLAPAARTRGVLYAYAAAPGFVAADAAGPGDNGPYAAALARYLTTPGLPAELMFKRVAEAVEDATGDAQQPTYESGLRGAEFYFAGGAIEGAPAPAPVTPPAPIEAPPNTDAARAVLTAICAGGEGSRAYCACAAQSYRDQMSAQDFVDFVEVYAATAGVRGDERAVFLDGAADAGFDAGRAQAIYAAFKSVDAGALDACPDAPAASAPVNDRAPDIGAGVETGTPVGEGQDRQRRLADQAVPLMVDRAGIGGAPEDVREALRLITPDQFIFFEADSAALSTAARARAEAFAAPIGLGALVRSAPTPAGVERGGGPVATAEDALIEGDHDLFLTSACARDENRRELCGERAGAVRAALIEAGVPEDRIRGANSVGKNRPLAQGTDAESLALNRYVWIQVVPAR